MIDIEYFEKSVEDDDSKEEKEFKRLSEYEPLDFLKALVNVYKDKE